VKKILCDVEIYSNVFLCSIKDYDTKETTTWEISERMDESDKIRLYFNSFKGFLITFNGIHYDEPMLLFLMENKFKDWKDCTTKLKGWSNHIINNDFWWKDYNLKKYKYQNKWFSVDLFLYWSKMLRLSKKLSLKSLAVQLNYPVIQELPFPHDAELTYDNIDALRHYNAVHDLGITERLHDKLIDEIRLRCSIYNEYKLKCFSWDAPKIATEVLAQSYAQQKGIDTYDVTSLSFTKPVLHLGELLKDFDPKYELPIFQKLYKDVCNSTDGFSSEINVDSNNTLIKLSYGIGGLHSVNKDEIYESNDDSIIITSDFSSLYPNLIINYNLIRFPEVLQRYSEIKQGRIQAKREGNKAKDALYKLVLNSTSGMLDNEYSWLYYPEGAMKLRLIGQLILTKLAEKCIVAGYKVVSCNTDGIETILPKSEMDNYMLLMGEIEQQFNLQLEHDIYNKIVYSSVNDYIAITEKGKIKEKGLFVTNPVLSNSTDFLVIPKALQAYFVSNTNPSDFVKGHTNIFDFCAAQKADKSYTVEWNGINQQRLNRYYASKTGAYLYKCKWVEKTHPKTKVKYNEYTKAHMLKDTGVQLYNNHEDKPMEEYKIDYSFYIGKIMDIINELHRKNQITLF
jgi:hypothetical protein